MGKREVIEPKEWPWYDHKRYSFCMAARKGDYLFFSGNTASEFDPATKKMVCKGDIIDQAGVNYEKIKLLLETAGGSMDDIVKATDYITPTGLEKYPQLEQLRKKYFGDGGFAAGTPLVVNHLLRADAFIEIECVAVLGSLEKKKISPGWSDYGSATYQPGVLKGDLLFISGQVGVDQKTGEMVSGDDIAAQTRQAYQNIEAVLNEAGASFADIVKTIAYVAPAGLPKYNDTEKVRREFFKGSYSAHTAVVVYQNLPKEALIKVDAVAVVGNSKKETYDLDLGRKYQGLTYRPVVRKGKLIALSGVTSIDLESGELVSGDVVDQMKQVLKNAERMLSAAGLGWEDVLMVVDFIVPDGEAGYRGTAKVRHEVFKGALPPSTGVVQNELVGVEGLLINVDIVAAAD